MVALKLFRKWFFFFLKMIISRLITGEFIIANDSETLIKLGNYN